MNFEDFFQRYFLPSIVTFLDENTHLEDSNLATAKALAKFEFNYLKSVSIFSNFDNCLEHCNSLKQAVTAYHIKILKEVYGRQFVTLISELQALVIKNINNGASNEAILTFFNLDPSWITDSRVNKKIVEILTRTPTERRYTKKSKSPFPTNLNYHNNTLIPHLYFSLKDSLDFPVDRLAQKIFDFGMSTKKVSAIKTNILYGKSDRGYLGLLKWKPRKTVKVNTALSVAYQKRIKDAVFTVFSCN